jgi:DNA replication protein DnaC
MNEEIKTKINVLGFNVLKERWDDVLSLAQKKKPSYTKFLTEIIIQEHSEKVERMRQSRLNRAKIPELLIMETFPFIEQPRLKKPFVMELYDSQSYMKSPQSLIFIGPTGCGKSGLATSFLIHSINNGYRGFFIDFKDLLDLLYQSIADHSENQLIKRFQTYDILTIDELGYHPVKKEQAGLFFKLMKSRHNKKTTLITTQLGFDEWGSFLQNKHLTAAMVDRITENCTVFNMKECISLRPKKINYATKGQKTKPVIKK